MKARRLAGVGTGVWIASLALAFWLGAAWSRSEKRPIQKSLAESDMRVIQITADGGYYLDGKTISLEQIGVELGRLQAVSPRLNARLQADQSAGWNRVAAVVDRLNQERVRVISFAASPEGRP